MKKPAISSETIEDIILRRASPEEHREYRKTADEWQQCGTQWDVYFPQYKITRPMTVLYRHTSDTWVCAMKAQGTIMVFYVAWNPQASRFVAFYRLDKPPI